MDRQRTHILLVEDDEIDREIVHRLLGPEYAVQNAATGNEAIALLQGSRPKCAVVDYRLPDLDGMQLISILVKSNIPTVVLTGIESPEIVVKALQLGAQDYLVKSHLTSTGLRHAIDEAIKKVALQRELMEKQQKLAEQTLTLAEKNQQISALASALTLAEQHERRRIAQVLHDDLQQILYGVQMRAHLLSIEIPLQANPEAGEQLDAITKLVVQAIQKTRSLAVELSPPVLPNEGLQGVFNWLAAHMREMYNLDIQLALDERCELSDEDLRVLLFQIVRELLFNVVKHAGVLQALLTATGNDEHVLIRVEDNGAGFADPANNDRVGRRGGFGLYSARERLHLFGGELTVNTDAGKGTTITIMLPKNWKR